MYIKQFKIEGHSGFGDSGWVSLSPKINVVIGENNSGKSSLLKSLSGQIANNPHKTPERYLPGHLGKQCVKIDISSTRSEFLERLALFGGSVSTNMGGPTVADVEFLKKQINKNDIIDIFAEVKAETGLTNREPTYKGDGGRGGYIANISVSGGELQVSPVGAGQSDNTIAAFFNDKSNAFFHFPAERYHRSLSSYGRVEQLAGDGSNLAGFLQYLQGNDPQRFEEVVSRLRQVIPSIERITIDSMVDGFKIIIWPYGSGSNRDLAFYMEDCGTGVSQILAIFAAAVSKRDSCIIVDEINSFLHPRAVKDLLGILATEYPSNQYIISSHSSDVVSHPSVSRVIVVERDGFESKVKTLNKDDISSLKGHLLKLGVSMSDVLGADMILWVEGPTESVCFPNLIRDHLTMPHGLQILSVSATGDFDGPSRGKKAALRIYERVIQVVAPLATGQSFLLDRESLSDDAVSQAEAETGGKLRFIGRRCLENYVLLPSIIAAMLREDPEFALDINESDVRDALTFHASESDVRGNKVFKGDLFDVKWLKDTDGAKILTRTFQTVSDNTYVFRKTLHTPLLVSMAGSEHISELVDTLKERLEFLGVS